MKTNPITTWHVCISGYTQSEAEMTGLMRIALELGARHRGPATAVELHRWNDDWKALAEFIWLARPNGDSEGPVVNIYAYSWGAGWGFTQLAKALKARGIAVRCAVLADPVYRSRWWSMLWRSLSPFAKPRIEVPANVRKVWWFYQHSLPWYCLAEPRGHRLTAEEPSATVIHEGVKVSGVIHHYMDDLRAFFDKCLEVAA